MTQNIKCRVKKKGSQLQTLKIWCLSWLWSIKLHLTSGLLTDQSSWSVPLQPFQSPSPLPISIFHKGAVTNLSEWRLGQGRRDWWADRGGSGLVRGCFTAYISHTFVDLLGKENGPMRGLVVVVWGGGGYCVWTACLSECVRKRVRRGRGGGGSSWRIDGVNLS